MRAVFGAIPGRGRMNHINEQHLSYWVKLFEEQGYAVVEALWSLLYGNELVEWWHQQNIVLFAAPGHQLLYRGFANQVTGFTRDYITESEMNLPYHVCCAPSAMRWSGPHDVVFEFADSTRTKCFIIQLRLFAP
jgi:hypothetical protein